MEIFEILAQIHVDGIPQVSANSGTLQTILSLTFTATGGVSALFIIIGALRYSLSGGDQGAIQSAKNTIMYALIGLVVSLSAFAIVQFVLGQLGAK